MSYDPKIQAHMKKICLSLPDTEETMTWGKPHYRVNNKIFAGCGEENGQSSVGFKLEMDHARAIVVSDPRFSPAPYVGHKGWVSMDASGIQDWNEVRDLVLESYRLIAPKRSLAKLDTAPVEKKPAKPASKSGTSKKTTKAASGGTRKSKSG
jgi:predicted DNA-binding protein (MmcQ/YjbR family)